MLTLKQLTVGTKIKRLGGTYEINRRIKITKKHTHT